MTAVLLVVLGTAVLHAGWNAIAKSIADPWVASLLIGLVFGVAGLAGVLLFGLPAGAAWPFLAVSALAQVGYLVLLTGAYGHGELSRLYPVARGTAPVLVTGIAMGLLGERPSGLALLGVAVLVAAIGLLAGARGWPRSGEGIGLAVATGAAIALYTVVDGIGVRRAGDPLAYIAWLFLLHGPLVAALSWWRGGPDLGRRARRQLGRGLIGGLLSVLAYGVVVWAQSRAPLALVAAARETSVVWAVLIGRIVLGERLVRLEVAAVGMAAAGAAAVQLGA